jgi:hypothetical protein
VTVVDQLLLAGALVPPATMVLLLWAALRLARERERAEATRTAGDAR